MKNLFLFSDSFQDDPQELAGQVPGDDCRLVHGYGPGECWQLPSGPRVIWGHHRWVHISDFSEHERDYYHHLYCQDLYTLPLKTCLTASQEPWYSMTVSRPVEGTHPASQSTSRPVCVSSSPPLLMRTRVRTQKKSKNGLYRIFSRPADQVPVPRVHDLRPEELPPLRRQLWRCLELWKGDGPRAGHRGETIKIEITETKCLLYFCF